MAKAARKADASKEAAGVGHNSTLSADQRLGLARIHLRAAKDLIARRKAVQAEDRQFGKVVKLDLGENGLEQIKIMIAMETPEGEAKVKAKLQAQSQAASWAAGDDGQFDMFAGQLKPTETQAFIDGKLAGMDGMALRNPYGPETVDAEDYARGHQYGTKIVDDILADKAKAKAELIEGPGHDNGGDLDEEEGE